MEQGSHEIRLRVKAREVWTFVEIAVNAGEREIVGVVTAAMDFGDDMFDVQRGQRGIFLAELTLLATMAGALPDAGFRLCIHLSGFLRDEVPCLPLKDRDEFVCSHVTRVLRLLRIVKLALRGFLRQRFDTGLKFCVGAEI